MKKIKLGDVCQFSEDRTAVASLDETNYISTENLLPNKGGITDAATLPKTSTTPAFVAGNVLLSNIRPYFKKIWYATFDGGCSADVLILKVNKCIDAKFLYYALSEDKFFDYMTATAKGTKMPRGDKLSIMNYSVPDFSLAMQKKIAALLGALDDKIALNKKINATLEAMAKTLYDYWFVQFEFPDENGKPYKTSGGKMIYSSELGRDIPIEWEIETLEGKISITRGISYSTETLSTDAEGIPMINLASVDRKRNYSPDELKFFIGDVPNEKKLQAIDMLIACTDLTRQAEIIGSPILVMNDREYTFSMDLAKLTVTDEKLNELYLYMTLRTDFYHQYIVGFASGTTVLHLNTNGIAWYKVLIPPITLQEEFAEVMKNIYLQTCKTICENQRLAELRDWLLPMLMNGQVTCKKGKN